MNRAEMLECLERFPFDRKDYWLVAGGAMLLYGIRQETADIDLGCTKEMADRLEEEGWLYRRMDDGRRWFKYGDTIELSEDWMGDWVTEYDGFRVLTPEGIIRQKEELGREKDFRDIELLKEYLGK